jgi:hypothetical protein
VPEPHGRGRPSNSDNPMFRARESGPIRGDTTSFRRRPVHMFRATRASGRGPGPRLSRQRHRRISRCADVSATLGSSGSPARY